MWNIMNGMCYGEIPTVMYKNHVSVFVSYKTFLRDSSVGEYCWMGCSWGLMINWGWFGVEGGPEGGPNNANLCT